MYVYTVQANRHPASHCSLLFWGAFSSGPHRARAGSRCQSSPSPLLPLPLKRVSPALFCLYRICTVTMLHAGVRWSSYGENPHLQDFFKVLSLSADRDERIYISTIEAHKVRHSPWAALCTMLGLPVATCVILVSLTLPCWACNHAAFARVGYVLLCQMDRQLRCEL